MLIRNAASSLRNLQRAYKAQVARLVDGSGLTLLASGKAEPRRWRTSTCEGEVKLAALDTPMRTRVLKGLLPSVRKAETDSRVLSLPFSPFSTTDQKLARRDS
jgi:hypothetical protein